MNRYILLHRLTGPAILLLLGVVALLYQAHVVRFSIFVPLLLILIGVIKLAERAVLAQEMPPTGYPPMGGLPPTGTYPQGGAYPYQGPGYTGANYQEPKVTPAATPTPDFGNDPEGGK